MLVSLQTQHLLCTIVTPFAKNRFTNVTKAFALHGLLGIMSTQIHKWLLELDGYGSLAGLSLGAECPAFHSKVA